MKKVLDFLTTLRLNNNKPWFDANKNLFLEAQSEFNDFALKLMDGVEKFDPSIRNLQLKDCTYRIYRDVRFGHDKTPYKTYFGVYIAPGGKKSGYAGYYFHIEATGDDNKDAHVLAAGSHCPQPKVLESIRSDIYDDPQSFLKLLKNAKEFRFSDENKLKRVPKGFSADFEYAGYLMYKDYSLYRNMTDKEILSPQLLDIVLTDFKKTQPFIEWLNRATKFAYEEMM